MISRFELLRMVSNERDYNKGVDGYGYSNN